ncbi:MAG: transglutaminase family protein, partial [Ectothiorhodospiraceae bacterium]|nr:transglutaminase family protein [Ectothiorhodospiraceae bacterium]
MSIEPPIPRVALRHRLDYRFDRPVRLSTHWLRLRPAPQTAARIQAYSLSIRPGSHFINWVRDPFENHLARLDFPDPVTHCSIDMELLAELPPVNPFDFLLTADAASHPFSYADQLARELAPYLGEMAEDADVARWLQSLDRTPVSTLERLQQMASRIAEEFHLEPFGNDIDLARLLRHGAGSHRELAWLLTVSLRALGVAMRLVSGYRLMLSSDPHAHLHTWCEAYLPGAGWIGLDPASGLLTTEQHIPLCTASDPLRALPVLGYRESCEESVREQISLGLLEREAPEWPYSAAQWTRLEAAADSVDQALESEGVPLTQSSALEFGKPERTDAPEWSSTGLGPDKWRAGTELLQRLRAERMNGSLILLGQGEWFAGERQPRWALHCLARRDGAPLWSGPDFTMTRAGDEKAEAGDAATFAGALAASLGLEPGAAIPAFEDQLYQLWQQNEPMDYVPGARELNDPEQRLQLEEQLSQVHTPPTGFVIPLHWDYHAGQWRSAPWHTRRQRLYLAPGEFPIGYRLPLNALPAGDAGRPELPPEYSPWDCHAISPSAPSTPRRRAAPPTAVCIEWRDDRLYAFLPPRPDIDQFQRLVQALEKTARKLDMPVVLEGYPPPHTSELQRLTV